MCISGGIHMYFKVPIEISLDFLVANVMKM
jgi:hypothetical protein